MKVFDVFPFYNEFDILEIRLEELWNTVDQFVLIESNTTFTGKAKPYLFEENKERYTKYLSKIRHIKLDASIEECKSVFPHETDDNWTREKYQRYAAVLNLTDVQDEDLVIIADCDEIPRAEIIDMIKVDENNYDRYHLFVIQCQYKINYMKIHHPSRHGNIMVTRGRVFTNPQREREYTFHWTPKPENTVSVDHGGWHLSYFGDEKHCINKIQSFSHSEQNKSSIIDNYNIDWMIRNRYGQDGTGSTERFEIVVVDDYFPKHVYENIDRWQHMIVPNAGFTVHDLYRENDTN